MKIRFFFFFFLLGSCLITSCSAWLDWGSYDDYDDTVPSQNITTSSDHQQHQASHVNPSDSSPHSQHHGSKSSHDHNHGSKSPHDHNHGSKSSHDHNHGSGMSSAKDQNKELTRPSNEANASHKHHHSQTESKRKHSSKGSSHGCKHHQAKLDNQKETKQTNKLHSSLKTTNSQTIAESLPIDEKDALDSNEGEDLDSNSGEEEKEDSGSSEKEDSDSSSSEEEDSDSSSSEEEDSDSSSSEEEDSDSSSSEEDDSDNDSSEEIDGEHTSYSHHHHHPHHSHGPFGHHSDNYARFKHDDNHHHYSLNHDHYDVPMQRQHHRHNCGGMTSNHKTRLAPCPMLYKRIGLRCISIFSIAQVPWQDANNFCESIFGELLTFNGIQEYFEFMNHIQVTGSSSDFWIGGKTEGRSWKWVNGSPMPLGSPYWAIRTDEYVRWQSKTEVYSQAPMPVSSFGLGTYKSKCASMSPKYYYYMNDEDCEEKRSPVCVLKDNTEIMVLKDWIDRGDIPLSVVTETPHVFTPRTDQPESPDDSKEGSGEDSYSEEGSGASSWLDGLTFDSE